MKNRFLILSLFFCFPLLSQEVSLPDPYAPSLLIDASGNPDSTKDDKPNPADYFDTGTGTAHDPYTIKTPQQLTAIRWFTAAHYILDAPIDMATTPELNGENWEPIGNRDKPFTGSFNGNNFWIDKLEINHPETDHNGLFGYVVAATIENLKITNATIYGNNRTGILSGQIIDSHINNIEVGGEVNSYGEYIGGLVGMAVNSTMSNCISHADVTGHKRVGGLAGYGITENSAASGVVAGVSVNGRESYQIGGLIGQGYALNSSATGNVTGGSEVGGLIGSGSARGSFATGNVTATGDYVGGLIGDLNRFSKQGSELPEYSPGEPAGLSTSDLKGKGTSSQGEELSIELEDSTTVYVPEQERGFTITIERMTNDLPLEDIIPSHTGFSATGSMRQLSIEATGELTDLTPYITIPAVEAGSINPATINAVRVGDMDIDGEWVENHVSILPVWIDDNGNYNFMDPLLIDGMKPEEASKNVSRANSQELSQTTMKSATRWIGNTKYFLMSFENSINWSKDPELHRMIPDTSLTAPGLRRVASLESVDARNALMKKPVCNIVILVHGHNEEEKDGYLAAKIDNPWEFEYKRLVWELLYEEFIKNRDATEIPYPFDCTAFYEFVYPTYRPIFSPVLDGSTFHHETLGESLGKLVNRELQNNPQLRAMIEHDIPFNLFVIAHSQGGLVARAGLRFMNQNILKNLQRVITWGSPHTGAGLYTLRYALTAGHHIEINGTRLPMQNIGQTEAYQSGINALAMDAPGIRDLRWDASKKHMLRLDSLFRENTSTINNAPHLRWPDGNFFFSSNLTTFNNSEGSFMGNLLTDKYMFYHGTTPKMAELELSTRFWGLYSIYNFARNASEIEKGAFLNRQVMKPEYSAGDGAVPLSSQRGDGIWPDGGIQRRAFTNMDHEEFYGAEKPHRNLATLGKGRDVAQLSFHDADMRADNRRCPWLEAEIIKEEDQTRYVEGQLFHQLVEEAGGLMGQRIERAEIRIQLEKTSFHLAINHKDDGSFRGELPEIDAMPDKIGIAVILKDGSEVIDTIPLRDGDIYNRTQNIWYDNETDILGFVIMQASDGDEIIVYPGTFVTISPIYISNKNIKLSSYAGPEETIIEGISHGITPFYLSGADITTQTVIEGFTVRKYREMYFYINGASPTITNNIFTERTPSNQNGGAINVRNGSPNIHNNVFLDLEVNRHGGALYINGGSALVANNSFTGNSASTGGAIYVNSGSPVIRDNDISANTASSGIVNARGGGIYVESGSPLIENNLIINNNGGGIHSRGNGRITGNLIENNFNSPGISLVNSADEVNNNAITGNKHSSGAGIRSQGGHPKIINNSISNNEAQFDGGGIHLNGGDVSDNDIVGNKANNGAGMFVASTSGANVSISQNLLEDNTATGNGGGIYLGTNGTTPVTGNTIKNNYAGNFGGGINGRAEGWERDATVTVEGNTRTVRRHVPCFTENSNNYSGNTHGADFGEWGPGADNWCDDAGQTIYIR